MQVNSSPQVFKHVGTNHYFITYVNGSGYFKPDGKILGKTVHNFPTGLSLGNTESVDWSMLIPVDDVVLSNHIINDIDTRPNKWYK